MLILGLDPSLSCTGWGVIRAEGNRIRHIANGQMKTDAKAPMAVRLDHLYAAIAAVIATYAPDRAAAEEVFPTRTRRARSSWRRRAARFWRRAAAPILKCANMLRGW